MKKLLALVLVLVLSLSVVACGKDDNDNKAVEQSSENKNETTPTETAEATSTPTLAPTSTPTSTPEATPTATTAPSESSDAAAVPTEEPVVTVEPTAEPTAEPTEAPVAADNADNDILQGKWIIDVEAIWELSKDNALATIDMSAMTEEEIETTVGMVKKAFLKSLNSSYDGTFMEFEGSTFRLKTTKNSTPFECECSFDGSIVSFLGDASYGAPEVVYDAESDRILLDTGSEELPFITYMRDTEGSTENPEDTDAPEAGSADTSLKGGPVTESELEGKWVVDTELFKMSMKSIIEEAIGIELTDEEYMALLEQAGDIDAYTGDMDNIYILFDNGKCFLGSDDGEEEVPFTYTDQGIEIVEDDSVMLFRYDADKKVLFADIEGYVFPFRHE